MEEKALTKHAKSKSSAAGATRWIFLDISLLETKQAYKSEKTKTVSTQINLARLKN